MQSRASWPLTGTTLLVMAVGVWLPASPFAASLGMTALPRAYWGYLAVIVLAYVAATQVAKRMLLSRGWI